MLDSKMGRTEIRPGWSHYLKNLVIFEKISFNYEKDNRIHI